MTRSLFGGVCAAALLAGSLMAQTPGARLRVLHASPDAPAVDVYLNGAKVLANLPFKAYSEYLRVPPGSHQVKVNVAGTNTTVLQASPNLIPWQDYTAIAIGRVAGDPARPLDLMLLSDLNTAPRPFQSKIRVVHAAPGAPEVDVYLTTPYEALDAKTPGLSRVPYKGASGYINVDSGSYQARVAVAGTKTIAIDSGRTKLEDRAIRTFVAVDNTGGGAPFEIIVLEDYDRE